MVVLVMSDIEGNSVPLDSEFHDEVDTPHDALILPL